MVILLTSGGDRRETLLRDATAGLGYQIDEERSAFGDADVCAWGIMDPPCVIKLHDGRAVWELPEGSPVPSWGAAQSAMAQAVTDYEAAKV